jgi:L,D-peptidoglycan transpeptidase YkuD (ErfK/YbiS/YcfS/YnhG family)
VSAGMWQDRTAYPHLAVVEFNMNPVVPGRGSGIFLHAQTGGPTNGCISLRRPHLVRVLRWLRPSAAPRMTIGTRAGLRS